MPHYRIYFLGPSDEIVGADDFDCVDDADAMARASTLLNEHPAVEVWQQKRIVGKLGRLERTG